MSSVFSVVTWNVNSVRARLDQVLEYIDAHMPDVLCLQETKVEDALFPRVPFMEYGYTCSLHGGKGGYSGVAILSREKPANVQCGFAAGEEDLAPRVIAATVRGVRVYGLYCPNGTALDSDRFTHKLAWFDRLTAELTARDHDVPYVVCGDFNIAPDDRDVYDLSLTGSLHCTEIERSKVAALLAAGFQDCYRKHHAQGGAFTWWDYRGGGFERDHGLRIDHVYATDTLAAFCEDVIHDVEVRSWPSASDHAPVRALFRI